MYICFVVNLGHTFLKSSTVICYNYNINKLTYLLTEPGRAPKHRPRKLENIVSRIDMQTLRHLDGLM